MLYLFRKISCMALFHPKPNEFLHFDLESCNLMCTYTVVTHPCHMAPLAQARPMMLCIYTSNSKPKVETITEGYQQFFY